MTAPLRVGEHGLVTPGTSAAPRQRGPQVWRTADVGTDWQWALSRAEIDELLTAAAPHAHASREEVSAIDAASFGLPSMSAKLRRVADELTAGRGVQLVRGFPARDVTASSAAAVLAGIGSHLGALRPQNRAGDLVGQVRDTGADPDDPGVRIYQTAARQTFHTDSCDVAGLLCLQTARLGGDSLVVSVGAIYNEMLDRAPELAAALFEPIATDRRGEVPPGADPYFTIPVLSWFEGALTVVYQRQYIESAQRFETAPRLTPELVAALDLFDEIADDPTFHLRIRLEVGDMLFVHNHSTLHDRTRFVDGPDAPRHLLRVWLSMPNDRPLPPSFATRFGSTTIGDRGGICLDR